MQHKWLLFVLCCLVLVLGIQFDDSTHAQSAPFEAADCGFYVPIDLAVSCGYLTVPEDRANPDGPTMRLHVAIFTSISDDPLPDPVLYIPDGPGGTRTPLMQQRVTQDYAVFLEQRDFIVMDLRGSGYSEPELDCRAFDRLVLGTIEDHLSTAEVVAQQVEALDSCYQEHQAAGVNFTAYTSAENAADLRDLRLALGYEAWNVHSIGYGTRVALDLMRLDAEGLRSVTLDSPVAPQADVVGNSILAAQRGFQIILDRCEADALCGVGYPDLAGRVYSMVESLNETPATLPIAHPFTQQPYAMALDGNRMMETLLIGGGVTPNLQFMPLVMDSASFGNYGFVKLLVDQSLLLTTYTSEVTEFVTLCLESPPNAASIEANLEQTRAEIRDYLSIYPSVALEVCQRWGLPPLNLPEPTVIEADIPTLILTGEYDGATLPDDADAVAALVPNAYRYDYLGVAHSVLAGLDLCPLVTVVGFLANPSVDPNPDCYATQDGVTFVSRQDMLDMEAQMRDQAQSTGTEAVPHAP